MFSFSLIFTDTKNFIINNFKPIFLILLSVAIILQILTMLSAPDPETVTHIYNLVGETTRNHALSDNFNGMSGNEREMLISTFTKFIFQSLFIYLITVLINISISLSTIYNLSTNQLTINNLFSSALKTVPHIILFMLSALLYIVVLTLISLITSIPIIVFFIAICGGLFYMSIYFLFFALTTDQRKNFSFKSKIQQSFSLLKQFPRPILFMVIIWFTATIVIQLLIQQLLPDNLIFNILSYLIKITIDFFAICYFYRLYMLTKMHI